MATYKYYLYQTSLPDGAGNLLWERELQPFRPEKLSNTLICPSMFKIETAFTQPMATTLLIVCTK